ncbi:MAG: Ig-like domain-containing protein [Pirellulaceae bacterium]
MKSYQAFRARSRRNRKLSVEQFEQRRLLAADVWSQRGGDAGHSSYVDVAVNPATMSEAWFHELNYDQSGTGSWRERAVAIDQEHVYRVALQGYAPSGQYHVIAMDVDSGSEVWHRTFAGNAFEGVGEPSVAGGVVYVNRAGHSGISGGTSADLPRIYGLNAQDGTTVVERTYAAQWGSNERPVIEGGQMFVEDGYYGGISAYSTPDLNEQWFVGRSAAYDPPFAALNATFAFAFGNEVYNRATGARTYMTMPNLSFPTLSSPIVSQTGDPLFRFSGRTDAGASVTGIAQYDGASHQLNWATNLPGGVNYQAVGNGLVAATTGNSLYLLNESDGSVRRTWVAAGESALGEVVLTQDHAFVMGLNGTRATVYAVELNSGVVDWTHSQTSPGGSALVELAMVDGRLVLSDRTGVRLFTFNSENQPPVAEDDTATINEDVPTAIDVLANDSDPEQGSLSIVALGMPSSGSVQLNDAGEVVYTPAPNFHGSDSFTYTISDNLGQTSSATVEVVIESVNDLPEVTPANFVVAENSPVGTLVGVIEAIDVDGDELEFSLVGEGVEAFAIDDTGRISVLDAALLDYETHPVFDLEVVVSDAVGTSSASVQIELLNEIEVAIDIAPGDDTNTISDRSKFLSVAILTNSDVNPLTMLDLTSLRLRAVGGSDSIGARASRKHGVQYESTDVNGDGLLDLVVKFEVRDLNLSADTSALELTGDFLPAFGGLSFSATQAVDLNSPGKGKKK